MKQLIIKMPSKEHRKFKVIATMQGKSMNAVINQLVAKYIAKNS